MKTLSPEFEKLTKLAHRLADGGASPADRLELEKTILESPDAADWLANFWRAEVEREQVIAKAPLQQFEEEKIAAQLAKQARRVLFWQQFSKNCARAAAVGVVSTGAYLLWPSQSDQAQIAVGAPTRKLPAPNVAITSMPSGGALVHRWNPLPKVLDDFFLPSVGIAAGTTLGQAFQMVADQIRTHNHLNRAELASLEFNLPTEFNDRPVSGLSVTDIAAADALAILAAQVGAELTTGSSGALLADVKDPDAKPVAFHGRMLEGFFGRSESIASHVPVVYWELPTTELYGFTEVPEDRPALTLDFKSSNWGKLNGRWGNAPPPEQVALANWGIEVAALDQAAPPSAEEDLKWAKRRANSTAWFFQPQDQEPELSVTLTAKGNRTLQAVQKALRKPKSTTVEAKLSSNAMVIAGRLLVPNAPDKILSAKETEDWLAQGANQKEMLTYSQAIDFRNGAGVTLHAEPTATFALTDLLSLGRADDDYGVPREYQTRWMDVLAEIPTTPSIATNATREGEVVRLDGTLTWPPQEGQPDSGRTETFTVYIPAGQAALLNIPGRPGQDTANYEVLLRVR